MKFHEMNETEVEQALNADSTSGLTEDDVKKRRNQFGKNELEEGEKQSALLLFFSQFKDFMVLVLLAATLISGLLGEYIDAVAIIAIVIINGLLGFFQERKAERSLQALKELSAPQVSVLRKGEWIKITSKDVVVGDLLKFSSGDRVGADVRIIESNSLEIEESALTGESLPVAKSTGAIKKGNIGIGDMENMAFMSTLVTRGSGMGIVVATGMKTAMGQIADLLQNAETMTTPLQRRLEQLGKILITVALILTVLVVVAGVIQGHDLYTMFLAGVSLAVAAIPEGLPAIVTVALSLGVQRMIKKKAIVRKLPAVETLGCASVICSDKTGTMTQNKMTVTHLWSGGKRWLVDGVGYEPQGNFYRDDNQIEPREDKALQQMLMFGMLCNHAEIKRAENEFIIDGDPTEGALLVAAMKAGYNRDTLLSQYQIMKEFPFDSERKMMSIVVKDQHGKQFIVTKGAPDVLAGVCESILWDGKRKFMNREAAGHIQKAIEDLASQALRTIAIGLKELSPNTIILDEKEAEKGLTFIGLQGMIDPPRPEVKEAVKECKEAGIKTVMITGDHVITAPAIKAADIGVAMGITGTDVAKESSALVLLDDNFATIKAAIKEGRNIYENIRKFIRYLLASNVGEILVMLFAMILGLPLPLVPIQILWVNLVTDGLPAMALGLDQPEDDVMKRKPRNPREGVFARGLGWKVVSRGFLIGVATLLAFIFSYHANPDNLPYAQTIAFATLVLAQLIHVFDCRSEKSVFARNPFGNKYLVWAVISSLLLLFVVIYYPPLQPIFHTIPIEMKDWLMVTGLAAVPTFLLAGSFLLTKRK